MENSIQFLIDILNNGKLIFMDKENNPKEIHDFRYIIEDESILFYETNKKKSKLLVCKLCGKLPDISEWWDNGSTSWADKGKIECPRCGIIVFQKASNINIEPIGTSSAESSKNNFLSATESARIKWNELNK
jgi:hypothetical protein